MISFSGFVDVYNLDKFKVSNRNLYIKRFEEAWYIWKLRTWIFNFDHLSLSTRRKIAYFESKDIETTIQNYYLEFKNWFVIFWCNNGVIIIGVIIGVISSFPANCKKTSKLSHSLEYKFYFQYF
jgi:hypothetical protein